VGIYTELSSALSMHGLRLRGGFHPCAADGVPDDPAGVPARTLLLVGTAGAELWPHFAAHIDGERHPLDRWTRTTVGAIAGAFGARAVFPFDTPPLPFQRWALRCEPVRPSPIGILMHPDHGLWHAYRAALLFSEPIELPVIGDRASPCTACEMRPCLRACPVGAFTGAGYDVAACAAHLDSSEGRDCLDHGCRARDACPVAAERAYPPDQIRFHMTAFHRAVGRR
jgi:ferredoxin